MSTNTATLTDTQKFVLTSGEAMAKELGLTPLSYTSPAEVEFSEGQTVLLLSPNSVTVGTIETEVREYTHPQTCTFTDYLLDGEIIYRTAKRQVDGEWVQHFTPRLYVASDSKLYVSAPAN